MKVEYEINNNKKWPIQKFRQLNCRHVDYRKSYNQSKKRERLTIFWNWIYRIWVVNQSPGNANRYNGYFHIYNYKDNYVCRSNKCRGHQRYASIQSTEETKDRLHYSIHIALHSSMASCNTRSTDDNSHTGVKNHVWVVCFSQLSLSKFLQTDLNRSISCTATIIHYELLFMKTSG